MHEHERMSDLFEEHRQYLLGVAFRMLGSVYEADDAVQETWFRLSRSDMNGVDNLRGWLTTVIGRICLDVLRSRASRKEVPLDWHVPDPIVTAANKVDPELEALLGESVGLALYIVLETLSPSERLAFVLHDMFSVPFDEIGTMLERSANAAKQLASRARQRVRGAVPATDMDLGLQRDVVDAFFAAARSGDFAGLVSLLDPNIILRADMGAGRADVPSAVVHGAHNVAGRALMFASPSGHVYQALVNGAVGVVVTIDNRPVSVMGFTVSNARIVAIDALADPARLSRLDLSPFVKP